MLPQMSHYDKSVIKIDINFENEVPLRNKPPKPVYPKKVRKDRITLIQPSAESKKTTAVIDKRIKELEKFRRESISAIEAPLLMTALVKKTNERLSLILEEGRSIIKPQDKFQWAARVVHVLVSSCMRWRRYKKSEGDEKEGKPGRHASVENKQKYSGIGFDSRTFKEESKLSEEMREILTSHPRLKTTEQLKKVQRLCRSTRAFMIFPLEREMDLARYVGYERYDTSRVIACQGRKPERFYYVLSGRVSKVCLFHLATGVTKMSFGELTQGHTTDSAELQNATLRDYSLICKGPVEVLVLDREDFMELMTTTPDSALPTEFLKSIEFFRSFPMEKFSEEKDSCTVKYFAKDSVIVKDSNDTPYFYIVKSGRCKVVRRQEVPDLRKGAKLPNISTTPRNSPRLTPGKHPTSLLQLTNAYSNSSKACREAKSSESAKQVSKIQTLLPDEGLITEDNGEKEMDETTMEQTEDRVVINKRISDVSACVPTRSALLQIAVLKPGDIFGLEPMMPKVTSKISSEIVEENDSSPPSKSVILISEGAECIMISKRFFLMNATITTLVQLKALSEEYMTVEEARRQIQSQQTWNLYKTEMMKNLASHKKKENRKFR